MELTTSQLPEGITLPKEAFVYVQNEGYLRMRYVDQRTGTKRFVMLHRYIYEAVNGPIPDGYIVHHIDGEPQNNRLDNLALMPRKAHSRMHRLKPGMGSPAFPTYWLKNGERLKAQGRERRKRLRQIAAEAVQGLVGR